MFKPLRTRSHGTKAKRKRCVSFPLEVGFRPLLEQRWAMALLSCPLVHKISKLSVPRILSLHSFAFIYIVYVNKQKNTGLATTGMAMCGGLNSSSGGELKLHLGCTGSTKRSGDKQKGSRRKYNKQILLLLGVNGPQKVS